MKIICNKKLLVCFLMAINLNLSNVSANFSRTMKDIRFIFGFGQKADERKELDKLADEINTFLQNKNIVDSGSKKYKELCESLHKILCLIHEHRKNNSSTLDGQIVDKGLNSSFVSNEISLYNWVSKVSELNGGKLTVWNGKIIAAIKDLTSRLKMLYGSDSNREISDKINKLSKSLQKGDEINNKFNEIYNICGMLSAKLKKFFINIDDYPESKNLNNLNKMRDWLEKISNNCSKQLEIFYSNLDNKGTVDMSRMEEISNINAMAKNLNEIIINNTSCPICFAKIASEPIVKCNECGNIIHLKCSSNGNGRNGSWDFFQNGCPLCKCKQ